MKKHYVLIDKTELMELINDTSEDMRQEGVGSQSFEAISDFSRRMLKKVEEAHKELYGEGV